MIDATTLLMAGYRPEQLLSCPWNARFERCLCDEALAVGKSYPEVCGLGNQTKLEDLVHIEEQEEDATRIPDESKSSEVSR